MAAYLHSEDMATHPFIFFTRPIAAFFMALAFLSILRCIWIQVRTHAPEIAIDESDD